MLVSHVFTAWRLHIFGIHVTNGVCFDGYEQFNKKIIPVQALTFLGVLGYQTSRQSAHEGGKVSPTHRSPLPLYPSGDIPGTHFC